MPQRKEVNASDRKRRAQCREARSRAYRSRVERLARRGGGAPPPGDACCEDGGCPRTSQTVENDVTGIGDAVSQEAWALAFAATLDVMATTAGSWKAIYGSFSRTGHRHHFDDLDGAVLHHEMRMPLEGLGERFFRFGLQDRESTEVVGGR